MSHPVAISALPVAPRGATPHATPRLRSITDEGVRAGAFAATGVALWFLAADALLAAPLATPALLGRALGRVLFGAPALGAPSAALSVAVYTVVHYLAFAAFGVAAVAVLRVARRHADVLAGALLVFAAVEVAFAGLVVLLSAATTAGALAWPQLVAGNVVGCLLLGAWLWHRHPEVRGAADAGLRGTGAWTVR